MAMTGPVELPVRMRVGDGEEYEVGTLSLAMTPDSSYEDGVLSVKISPEPAGPALVALLREVADEMERNLSSRKVRPEISVR